MYRTGVMAPPDLYAQPPRPGLMTRGAGAGRHDVSLRSFLWCVALLLGVVELCVDSFGA
jgi:hypothetical protein